MVLIHDVEKGAFYRVPENVDEIYKQVARLYDINPSEYTEAELNDKLGDCMYHLGWTIIDESDVEDTTTAKLLED